MLIDIHAHFYTDGSRGDWQRVNQARLDAGRRIGITAHVASILGSWGMRSPIYFPSPDDVTEANRLMLALQRRHRGLVFGYCVVNPNFTEHAIAEIDQRIGEGLVGIKLAASRRANDKLLDPIAERAARHQVPILHHIWQHRRKDWPGQEASDALELGALAARHPKANFLLAHIGGGGDWAHSLKAVCHLPNVYIDLSGSGVDVGMLEATIAAVGPGRMAWGADITMDTGWAKLRYLESLGLTARDLELIRSANAVRLFPRGVFDAGH